MSRKTKKTKKARTNSPYDAGNLPVPKTCGQCGAKIYEAGPCPSCQDNPFGRDIWRREDE